MHSPAHLSPHGEGGIPDQGQGKGSVFTAEKSGIG